VRPVEGGALAHQPAEQESPDDDLSHVARLLPEKADERERARAGEELAVDQHLADQDPGPQVEAPEVERCDAEPDGRPDRGHRTGVVQRLPEFRGAVVRRREDDNARQIPQGGRPHPDSRRPV
jgi:hypothetical protein